MVGSRRDAVRSFACDVICRATFCACVLGMTMDPVLASASDGPGAEVAPVRGESFDFDVPAQPLSFALERYAVTADQTVLFSDALVAGRTSTAIKGRYVPRVALEALLAGTGLVADDSDLQLKGSFVLRQLSAGGAAEPSHATGLDRRYDGLVQARIWEALCADPRTAPGSYRASLRLVIDSNGQLVGPRLIQSTGSVRRDGAMLAALSGLHMGHPPPAGLRQPLTLVILPRDRVAGRACATEGAQ